MISCSNHIQQAATKERMANSEQFSDGKFHNKKDTSERMKFGNMVKIFSDFIFAERVDPVPTAPIPLKKIQENDFFVEDAEAVRFARLGHSTVMLQMGGKVWLIDPVFSERTSPVQWAGPKRFHPVPIDLEHLPPIEGVIISHDHYDHLDYDTILQMKDRVNHFITPLGVGARIAEWGISSEKIIQMDWWESKKIGSVEFVATPAQHFSGRTLMDGDTTLWNSWVIRTEKDSVFFSGDTGYFDGFKEIGEKYGPFDVAFMECGAYNKNWSEIHMMPEETLQAFKDLDGKLMVPIHNGTFDLALHPWTDPMDRIMSLAQEENINILIPYMGQIVDDKSPSQTVAWWNSEKVPVAAQQDIVLNPAN